jgi:hypothetical protein
MTTLVMAHGGRDPEMPGLRVPPGMQIDFYADFDENMFFSNGLAVVARGELGTPNESYTANDPIPNYIYSALSSDQLGWYLQLDRTDLPAWFVGNDLPDETALCTDFVGCDNAGANIGEGVHACDGVLGRAQAAGENHLVMLSCRGNIEDPDAQGTEGLVGADGRWDESFQREMDAEVERFAGLGEADREATWLGWPENTRLMFMTYDWMKGWADAYGAKQLLRSDGPQAFAAYYDQLDADAKEFLKSDPEVEEALTMAGMQNLFAEG